LDREPATETDSATPITSAAYNVPEQFFMSTPDDPLLQAAWEARGHAGARHSGFAVGAALETAEGRIYGGCNIESAAFGLTMCAERVALFKALSDGRRAFRRLAVVTAAAEPAPPCGACRQLLWEYAGNLEIVLANATGSVRVCSLAELFPGPFDASYLPGPPA
jgi:cytidine deaminase